VTEREVARQAAPLLAALVLRHRARLAAEQVAEPEPKEAA
jgi:hypothetical protein